MPDLDLYVIHNLNRRATSPELAAQLTARLNTAPDQITRQRLDIARSILGDPQRRVQYDAMLADPAAPTITEQTLAALSGFGTTAPGSRVPGLLSSSKTRLLTLAAAVLGLVVIIVVTVVSCGSDSTSIPVGADGVTTTAATAGDAAPDCKRWTNKSVSSASWASGARKAPRAILVLTDAYALPSAFAPLSDPSRSSDVNFGGGVPFMVPTLTQFQNRDVGVYAYEKKSSKYDSDGYPDAVLHAATLAQDGKLVSEKTYTAATGRELPKPFDLAQDVEEGYYRVEAASGVTIPSAAAGDKAHKNYVWALPDAFDENVVWVLARGSDKLYKAGLYGVVSGVEAVVPLVDKCAK
ncbi:MAG: hypothetical protein WBA38_12620 [Gordonia sp. (in: high G+C Gram-positive bacteria)]|uniref:hypothetical protein n=1 Tax=Gordonia sp. (in: high G+C Gram-positive bacteria) TaxID=84139 RepID=UPI003C750CFA